MSGFAYAFKEKQKAIDIIFEAQKVDPFEDWNSKLDTANPGKMLKKAVQAVVFEITLDQEECAHNAI